MLLPGWLFSQATVQWASEVIAYSSQLPDQRYSAFQVLGPPNSLNRSLSQQNAWIPDRSGSTPYEYLTVGFARPQTVQQIQLVESHRPGSILAIWLIDVEGAQHLVYEEESPRVVQENGRVFKHFIPLTSYQVASLRLEIDAQAARSKPAFDAIGISADKDPEVTATDQPASLVLNADREKLTDRINTDYADQLPHISPDGSTLFFSRKYHPQNMGETNWEDIWIARRQSSDWSRAINAGAPLNNRQDNRIVGIEANGESIYLVARETNTSRFTLYKSKKNGRHWSHPRRMNIEQFPDVQQEADFFVSPDGQYLLLSFTAEKNIGSRDLYVSFRKGPDAWSPPRHLGPTLNTVGLEGGACLAPDGRTLYFTSNGHPGEGGTDIYYSKRKDDSWTNWTTPRNLGPNVNTPRNEYHFSLPASGAYAYFVSEDPFGMADIYRIEIPDDLRPEPVVLVKGKLIDGASQAAMAGSLILAPAGEANGQTLQTSPTGEFQVILPHGASIGIFAEKEGFLPISQQVEAGVKPLKELDASPAYAIESDPRFSGHPELKEKVARLIRLDQELTSLSERTVPLEKPKNNNQNRRKNNPAPQDPQIEALRNKYRDRAQHESLQTKGGSGDAELAEMKERYNQATIAPSPLEENARPEQDADLQAMKDRFNNVHASGEKSTQQFMESSEVAVREELRYELAQATWLELRQQLIPQVSTDLLQTLSSDEQQALRNVLAQGIPPLDPEDIPAFQPPAPASTSLPTWVLAYREDLKQYLTPQIREELRKELESSVVATLKKELLYRLKMEQERMLKAELSQEMQGVQPADGWLEKGKGEIQPTYREVVRDIVLVPVKPGTTVPLHNVFFEANQPRLKPASYRELNRIADFLRNHPEVTVEIGGHTNGWCTYSFALELSAQRANAVVEYLLQSGVDASQITARGYGKNVPIASNETEEGRRQNQRIELTILAVNP